MYQMILFLIVIFKKIIILFIFTKIYEISSFFSNFLGGEHVPVPPLLPTNLKKII